MNKKTVLTTLFSLLLLISAFAQKQFEGTIVYKVSIEGAEASIAAMAFPTPEIAYKVKGHMMITEMNLGMLGSVRTVMNAKTNEMWAVTNVGGNQMVENMTDEDMSGTMEALDDVDIEITNETKEIAGHMCKKAITTYEDEGKTYVSIIYFWPEYTAPAFYISNPLAKKIPGLPLEFQIEDMSDGSTLMQLKATSVTKESLDDSLFEIPKG